ncbi:MAG: glycosyltransferase [Syntrophobacteraceae bacterium]
MVFYEENPQAISRADVVVAIPTFNEAESITRTAETASKGLSEFFGDYSSVLINCDNASTDGTREAFFSASGEVPKIYLSTEPDVRGKGNNLRNLFAKVLDLQAKAVVVVEADIKNLAPHWIKKFAEPILNGAGYVCPLYVRHKYEATLTNSIVYPLTRCLYGRRVRQPNAGDFAFRGQLAELFLNSPIWTESTQNFGIDIWIPTIALNARVPICQSFIGSPKIHRVKDPYAHLTSLFRQVVGTIFDLAGFYADFWTQVKWSKPTALYGMDAYEVETPVPVEMNATRLHERFLQGFDAFSDVWSRLFDQTVFRKLQEICGLGLQHFSLPSQTWAGILFDAYNAYNMAQEPERSSILDSLLPLYLGKVLTFVKKTERMSLQQAEEYIENECMIFEENKPYLIKVWE